MLIHGLRVLCTRQSAQQGNHESGKERGCANLGITGCRVREWHCVSSGGSAVVEVQTKAQSKVVATNSCGENQAGRGKDVGWLNFIPPKDVWMSNPQYL